MEKFVTNETFRNSCREENVEMCWFASTVPSAAAQRSSQSGAGLTVQMMLTVIQ